MFSTMFRKSLQVRPTAQSVISVHVGDESDVISMPKTILQTSAGTKLKDTECVFDKKFAEVRCTEARKMEKGLNSSDQKENQQKH